MVITRDCIDVTNERLKRGGKKNAHTCWGKSQKVEQNKSQGEEQRTLSGAPALLALGAHVSHLELVP